MADPCEPNRTDIDPSDVCKFATKGSIRPQVGWHGETGSVEKSYDMQYWRTFEENKVDSIQVFTGGESELQVNFLHAFSTRLYRFLWFSLLQVTLPALGACFTVHLHLVLWKLVST